MNYISIPINISIAILLGIYLDKYIPLYINNLHFVIFIQILLNVIIFAIFNFLCYFFNLGSLANNTFFISILLGVQQRLFQNIDKLKIYI